jgi:hypothetical protein
MPASQARRVNGQPPISPAMRPSSAPADSRAANHSSRRKVLNSTSLNAVPRGQVTKSRRRRQAAGNSSSGSSSPGEWPQASIGAAA